MAIVHFQSIHTENKNKKSLAKPRSYGSPNEISGVPAWMKVGECSTAVDEAQASAEDSNSEMTEGDDNESNKLNNVLVIIIWSP